MRHALITAGSKGLGRKVTEHLLEKNYCVTVNYRSDFHAVEELIGDYKQKKDNIHIVQGDVTNKEDIIKIVQSSYKKFGRIDTLINNAGPYIFERKKLVDYEDVEWYSMIEGNLSSVFHFVKQVVPIMREQHFGRIINYGFQGAEHASGWLYRSAFSAAKAGLASLTKTLAIEEAENGITVNMVCPGNIAGRMKESTIDEARNRRDDKPIGRSGTGEDIARLIGFLIHEQSDLITGSIIEATGAENVIHRFR
ncbi:SDR family oxidoreductase [Bacillus carboniphilus]|uniref:SDR family oxidoreductase n=1 Tax=Bacillus carboniphilus TaxID=86663 RepID=A0ABY9JXR6_9BACI|nr:SDR family oxidoreductase [Bacillus carboniphilus]WLR44179.1 SDR family oxidoreductase [Bacillus carboniphilus]